MSDRVILDPSLVLHPKAIVDLLEFGYEEGLDGVALPGAFREYGRNPQFLKELQTFYGLRRTADDRLVDFFLRTADQQMDFHFDDQSFALFHDLPGEMRVSKEILAMIAQEHAFLVHESWVFLRSGSALIS